MDPLNYVWYQHRWMRLAAKMFEVDGADVSPALGQAVRDWR
jgi:hypothetical protein